MTNKACSGRMFALSTLIFMVACVATPDATTTTETETGADDHPVQGSATAWGIQAELVNQSDGLATIEVTSAVRRLKQVCNADGCPAKSVYGVRASVLVDFASVLTGDTFELEIDNQQGAEEQAVTPFQPDLDPGTHCVVAINQFLPLTASDWQEEAMMSGMYSFRFGSGGDHCGASNLKVLQTEFRDSDSWDCGTWALVTLVDDGTLLPPDLMHLTVPACDVDQVLIQVKDGIIDRETLGVIPATKSVGYHVIAAPRPAAGTFRLILTLATRPADRAMTDISPPYSFPAQSG
ncbi:MAG: hypothetical protein H0T94_04095 [Acidimicrobiia bacterium]|nr:hypothetical protein [Acidimicrobiia bacterium]